ncbi:pyocin knob domain-containing protein [Cetobacterium sp. ZWU0022]|uniref:pyocin knob domain-containing protein n=1 Tax=Cetobacterium sp. ZWU0022 TaxID=1340502 RepID=UPI0006455EB6|nr:pyocin knob domain-containing protein [Cetobacterium sp. ZWU0022]
MNNIRDTLTNMINLKLPHGGYSGTGLDLQNNKVDKSITITAGKGLTGGGNLSANRTINISNADGSLVIGDDDIKVNIYDGVDSTSTNQAASPASVKKAYELANTMIPKNSLNINTSVDLNDFETSGFYNVYTNGTTVKLINAPIGFTYGTLIVIGRGKSSLSFVTQILTEKSSGCTYIRTRNDGSFAWLPWNAIYGVMNKPTKFDVGLENVDNTQDSTKSVRSAARLTTERKITIGKKINIFDGTSDIAYTLADVGALSKDGDRLNGELGTVLNNAIYGINQMSNAQEGTTTNLLRRFRNWYNSTIYHEVVDSNGWKMFTGVDPTYPLFEMSADMNRGLRIYNGYKVFHEGYRPTPEMINAPALKNTLISEDWNTVKAPGYYKVQNNTGLNKPPGYAYGILEVIRGLDNSEDRSVQIFYPHKTDEGPKIRMHNGSTWNAWTEIYTSGKKPTYSDVGAIGGLRLGTVISRQVWNSSQSATEDKGYVTTAVRNTNADNYPDNEYRRPLQALVNGSWVTVATV